MPYINIVWEGVDPPASPSWRMSWDSHLKERLKKYSIGFKRINMSFCPDRNNKIVIRFGSQRSKYVSLGSYRKCVSEYAHILGNEILTGVYR